MTPAELAGIYNAAGQGWSGWSAVSKALDKAVAESGARKVDGPPLADLICAAINTARHEERVVARRNHGEASADAHRSATRLAMLAANAMWTRLAQVAPGETGVKPGVPA